MESERETKRVDGGESERLKVSERERESVG